MLLSKATYNFLYLYIALFCEAQFGVHHLGQGHLGMTGDQTADLQVGGRPLYPLSHSRPIRCANVKSF